MSVEFYELNLSLQEYLYFQECPQKFRIHRLLNPVPYKMSFESHNYSLEQYRLRGYNDTFLEGIEMHEFFKNFHETYKLSIISNKFPEILSNNKAKSIYWFIQRDRFHQLENKNLWAPFKSEFKIMSEKQRGSIDCLEFCSRDENFSLLDYKRKPYTNDKELLLFYLVLLQDYIIENDLDIPEISLIGCYYYETGRYRTFNINEDEIQFFNKKLDKIRQDILEVNLEFKENNCINCRYTDICKIEQLRT